MQIELTNEQAQFVLNAVDQRVRKDGLQSAAIGLAIAGIIQKQGRAEAAAPNGAKAPPSRKAAKEDGHGTETR